METGKCRKAHGLFDEFYGLCLCTHAPFEPQQWKVQSQSQALPCYPTLTRYSHAENQEFLMEELQDRKNLNISGTTVKGTALESYQSTANFGQTRYKLLCMKLVRLQGSVHYYSIAYPTLNNDWKCLLSCFADSDHQFCYKFYHFYRRITFRFCQKVLLQPGLCPNSQLCPGTSQLSALWCSDIYGNLFSCLLKRSRKLF